MGFKTTSVAKNDKSDQPKVDYDALNEYVVKTAGLEDRETLIGYVAGIVDLGNQEQPDAEYEFDGDADDEAAEIEKHPNTYFKDGLNEKGKPARLKCFPQAPKQAVALAIDFPDIIIDKGQFFGESNPQPLRIFTGGQFYNGTTMIVARPTYLKVNKSLGDWSFDQKHMLHKMAVAAKLIKPTEVFVPESIDQLLGKAFQFDAQVYFKESKGKKYFTEYLKFVGGLGRGQVAPEPANQPFLIEFDGELTKSNMNNLRYHIINTIKQANNYDGSKIQEYLEGNKEAKEDTNPAQAGTPSQPKPAATPAPKRKAVVVDEDDDMIPF